VEEFILVVTFTNVEDQITWLLRASMDLILIGIEGFFWMSWLVCSTGGICVVHWGDFNVTRFPSDRLGEACLCPAMVEFSDFIFYKGMMDLPLVGRTFTWLNNWESPSWSIINRFLVSPTWET
jgi:hypothetical protein